MPRRRQQPDTRLDWRDPQMPVLRDYKMDDGTLHTVVDPDYERRYRELLMATCIDPTYHSDPTYLTCKRKPK